jgi:hypothetical protein
VLAKQRLNIRFDDSKQRQHYTKHMTAKEMLPVTSPLGRMGIGRMIERAGEAAGLRFLQP